MDITPKHVAHKAFTGSSDQFARTPKELYTLFQSLYRIQMRSWFDPCPVNPKRDGLKIAWKSPAYCNPPFRDGVTWFDKAVQEHTQRRVSTLLLLPIRSDARYMHRHVLKSPAVSSVVVLTHSVTFEPYTKNLATPIMLVTIGDAIKIHRNTTTAVTKAIPTKLITFKEANVSMIRDALPYLKSHLGPFDRVIKTLLSRSQLGARNLVVVTRDLSASIATMVEFLQAGHHFHEYTLLLIPARFNSPGFRSILPHVKCIYLISPILRFDQGRKSFLGTVGLMLGKDPKTAIASSPADAHTLPKYMCLRFVLDDFHN
jgi:hypothetical protein